MTLKEAVAILNERKHHGHDLWCFNPLYDKAYGPPRADGGERSMLMGFQAIEVAEKYLRERNQS